MARRDPSTDDPAPLPVEVPARRGRRWLLGGGASLVAVLALLWAERRPIAIHFIDRTLAADGVRARYRLATIGPWRQRLTDVVIGDPARPDLVADWIETETGIGPGGIALIGMRAGHVRARARLVDGRLSFGAIDRLLPAGGGKGGLPTLALDVADLRVRVETPAGVVGVVMAGRGRLDGGFGGRAAVAGGTLALGGCALAPPRATLRLWTRGGRVGLAGPASAAWVGCGATRWRGPRATVDLGLDPATGDWGGRWRLAGGMLADPRGRAGSVTGSGTVEARTGSVTGRIALTANTVAVASVGAASVTATGLYRLGAAGSFDGDIAVTRAHVAVGAGRAGIALAGTPLAALAARAGQAIDAAARSFDGSIRLGVARNRDGSAITLRDGAFASAGGARASVAGSLSPAGAVDGRLAIEGGGLPTIAATLRRGSAAAPVMGVATMSPYRAGGSALDLAPLSFAIARSGEARLASVATISGPLGEGGRVERLTLPIEARRTAGGAVVIGERCAPVSVGALATGGLRLDAARLLLCPIDGALVRIAANGTVGGGVRIGATRLAGRLGAGPVAIEAGGATAALATRAFNVNGMAVTLGAGEHPTRLAATVLTGTIAGGGAGRFEGASGRIGAVPLSLSHAAGTWRVASGALDLGGALTVADADAADPACASGAAAPPRFCPLVARDVSLRLADGRVAAAGTLVEPVTGTRVAAVTIAHDLAAGTGHADLSVDRLTFAKGGLQPDRLTRVTEGVIADVAGTIDGEGHIGWAGAGVTSTGRFATAGLDLAAAFGPVTGIAGQIAFTDLLDLVTAPGQQLSVASINPGVLVENGAIAFHTEPGVKVAVESARWPFAGGWLTLDPTLLDFSAPAERHLTFRLDGIAADRFIEQFDFENLAATGTFDGVLPMVFDAKGGRIEAGRLTVREGGGGLAYVGDLSQKELGFWGNLAFQALKSLRYRNLSILMNGPLDGEIVTEVRFAGVSQGQGAKSNFLIRRLQRLPFVFNVTIRAPFRTLLDGLDPARQAQLHLRELIDNARAPVQPPASGAVP